MDDYVPESKPFTYYVGEGQDGGTLKGLAKLIYDDQKKWILIYEANRDLMGDPNALPDGMSLTIPPAHQPTPKLETKFFRPFLPKPPTSMCMATWRWT